jgi:hydroxypyruvate isomerase
MDTDEAMNEDRPLHAAARHCGASFFGNSTERNAVVQASYTVNCSILLTELPLLDRPRAARDAGFEAVEFWWPFAAPTPLDAEVTAFIRAIQDAGVQLTGLNFAAGDMPSGDRGILSDPAKTTAFRDNVDVAVGIGATLGTRAFNALYGNRVEGRSEATQDYVGAENLAYAARAAERIGATVLVEPVSGAPRYPLKTAADAIRVIDRVQEEHGAPNLRLLADLYHLHVNGDDISAAIRQYGDRIGHVQIADAPGRGEPGTGEIPLDAYLAQLDAAGYTGYIGLEYKPTRPETFDWLAQSERGTHSASAQSLRPHAESRIQ